MLGELQQLAYGFEPVVAHRDPDPLIIDRLHRPESGAEDPASEVEAIRVQQGGDHDRVPAALQVVHQLAADGGKINIRPQPAGLVENLPAGQAFQGEEPWLVAVIGDQIPAAGSGQDSVWIDGDRGRPALRAAAIADP
ncbi:hypothetical protein GCM10011575_41500 [Microlunatus endophyticus]|uniref:Uncharacterized protein n=1 Tax=Microlunatus endophyticus TaxID=1716077 RepID=A0A917SFE9_9ACTN|nr:hypothetical protein GCM10011575_41500 [Microlunatus endophyticus]